MNYRFLAVERDCPHCIKYRGIIERFNNRLPYYKRIRGLDVADRVRWGIYSDYILDAVKVEGTPYLYIDGMVSIGISTPEYIESYLTALLREELLY